MLNAGWRFGVGVAYVLFLLLRYGHVLRDRRVLMAIYENLLNRKGIIAISLVSLSYFDYALVGWSVRFIDLSVSAILFETWPILSVLLLSFLYRGERYKKVSIGMYLLMILGLIGFGFVIVSQTGGFVSPDESDSSKWPIGVVMALVAAIIGALAVYNFKWATVFTLILSFRVARMTSRTAEEEKQLFAIFQKLDMFVRRETMNSHIRECLLCIDAPKNDEALVTAYDQAKKHVVDARHKVTDDEQQILAQLEGDLDALVHSKQQGLEFGELLALMFFSGITAFLAMSARPDVSGWIGFLVELFAILFSSVILFLIFHILDLHLDRRGQIIKRGEEHDWYGVVFRDARDRSFERWTSAILGFFISIAYGYLLWNKWGLPVTFLNEIISCTRQFFHDVSRVIW